MDGWLAGWHDYVAPSQVTYIYNMAPIMPLEWA